MTQARTPSVDARPELLLRDRASSVPPLRKLLSRIDRYPGLYLPRAAGAALAALIAYQGVILYGAIVTPLDGRPERSARPPQLHPATILTSFDPFVAAAATGPAGPAEATGLTLHGFRQDRQTGGGSAIISQADGAQRSFGVGEEIAPGVVLKQVGSDHVVVVRNGLDERLAFKDFGSTVSVATAKMPAASPAVEARPSRPAPRGSAFPARSIDFADPSTLPASLTNGPAR